LDTAQQPFRSRTWIAALSVVLDRDGGDFTRTRRLGPARFEHAVRRLILRRGGQKPCLRIVGKTFAALADPAGVTAHRRGTLERRGTCRRRRRRSSLRNRADSGTQVRAVHVVPVAAIDVEVEVARGLEGHVCRCRAGSGTVPMPRSGGIAHYVAGSDHVHAVLVGDNADAVNEDLVLAVVVLVRHGSGPGAEVHRHGIQARQGAGKALHPNVVRTVEQRPELVGYRTGVFAHRRTELVHSYSDLVAEVCCGSCGQADSVDRTQTRIGVRRHRQPERSRRTAWRTPTPAPVTSAVVARPQRQVSRDELLGD
jgi:hypothetical protein